MGNYRLTADAKADLRRVYRYGFETHGEAAADEYYAALFDRFDQLAEQPLLYPAVNSYSRNKPATLGVGQVIPGWTEALQLMKEGDKWENYLPSKLAYGERGAGAKIPPNSTLIFEVELISVD